VLHYTYIVYLVVFFIALNVHIFKMLYPKVVEIIVIFCWYFMECVTVMKQSVSRFCL